MDKLINNLLADGCDNGDEEANLVKYEKEVGNDDGLRYGELNGGDMSNGHCANVFVGENDNEDEEEGEIRDDYELKDVDDMACLFGNTPSMNGYIDDLIKESRQAYNCNYFDEFLLPDIDCLTDIIGDGGCDNNGDEKAVSKRTDDGNAAIPRDRFEMRDVPRIIDDDDSDDDSEDDDDDISEFEIPQSGSILSSLLRHDSDGDDMDSSRTSATTKSTAAATRKGRILDKDAELEYLIPVDLEQRLGTINISNMDELQLVGIVIQRIEGTQTVTMEAVMRDPILDIETVVFDEQKRKIGVIDNIFGTKREPLYLVICKDVATWQSFKGGEKIFVAPKVQNAYFTAAETELKGHDDPDSEIAFSDDEKEKAYLSGVAGNEAAPKKNKRKRNRQKQQPQQQNTGQPRNPFRSVNSRPFAARHPGTTPMWNGGNGQMNPFMNPYGHQQQQQYHQQQPFTSFPPPHMPMPMNMPPMMSHMFPPQYPAAGNGQYSSYQQFQQRYSSGANQSRR